MKKDTQIIQESQYLYGYCDLAKYLNISMTEAMKLKHNNLIRYTRKNGRLVFNIDQVIEDMQKFNNNKIEK